jgi:hypothetical protein
LCAAYLLDNNGEAQQHGVLIRSSNKRRAAENLGGFFLFRVIGKWLASPTFPMLRSIARCLLLAQSGHPETLNQCPLLGVKRTSPKRPAMSAFDPKRTFFCAWQQSNTGQIFAPLRASYLARHFRARLR